MGEIKFIKIKKAHAQWTKVCAYKGMEVTSHLMITQKKLITQFAEIQKELFKKKRKTNFREEENLYDHNF